MGLSGVNSPLPVGTDFDIVMIDKLFGRQFISSLKVAAFLPTCCKPKPIGTRGLVRASLKDGATFQNIIG